MQVQPSTPGRGRKDPPLEPRRQCGPGTPWYQTSSLQTVGELISLPGAWPSVMATPGY